MYTCAECGRRFGGLSGFDQHQMWRLGEHSMFDLCDGCGFCTRLHLTCLDPEEVGMRLNGRGVWVQIVDRPFPRPGGEN